MVEICQSQLRSESVAFSVYILGCSPSRFVRVILVGSFLDLILTFRSSLPGRRSIGSLGSIVAYLSGMVCLATCLIGCVNSFWLSFSSVAVFVVVVVLIVVCIVVWDFGIELLASMFFIPGIFGVSSDCSFCFFSK